MTITFCVAKCDSLNLEYAGAEYANECYRFQGWETGGALDDGADTVNCAGDATWMRHRSAAPGSACQRTSRSRPQYEATLAASANQAEDAFSLTHASEMHKDLEPCCR
ncbi:hypothetical protein R3P38DRAFT_106161 [Favolaschia claudopus]|uniref:Uncharacterized protein n=1 Tax=Favolaschia claudopus TaxID=2862362 RepID=A0AAV9ZYN6_9AGAR